MAPRRTILLCFQLCREQRLLLLIGVVCMLAVAGAVLVPSHDKLHATSHVLTELEGYAWSSTIGWVSLNCSNTNTCGSSNYKVEILDTMRLVGYGWSNNIGWVQFGGLSGCPSGTCAARINTSSNELEGWARARAYGDGWDGWVSLNCSNSGACGGSDYAVSVGVGSLNDYAWGDDVVGWLNWSHADFDSPYTPGYYACEHDPEERKHRDQWGNNDYDTPCAHNQLCNDSTYVCEYPPNPTLNEFSVDPKIVRQGETVTVTWDVEYASSCTVEGGTDSWSGLSGNETSSPINGQTTFTLRCVPADGTSPAQDVGEVTVRIIPNVTEN